MPVAGGRAHVTGSRPVYAALLLISVAAALAPPGKAAAVAGAGVGCHRDLLVTGAG